MTIISITGSLPPLDEGNIQDVEQILGVQFPDDYRNFLLQHNGGHPQPNVFKIIACPRSDFGVVNWLLSANGGKYNLLSYARIYEGRLPSNLVAIGDDPGGNLLCISVSGTDSGSVYFWEHEYEALDGETPNYSNVHKVAESFDQFLLVLKHTPDDL